jgi:hypothetical protein
MCFRCDEEEVLKFHALWRRALRQPDALALSEKECNSITQFHTCEMNSDTRSGADTEGVECRFCGRRERFGSVSFF